MVALPLCPSPSQSAVSKYVWGSTSCGVVSTREVIVLLLPRFWSCIEIRGIHESGMGPYLPRVRRKCPPLMGLYPPVGRRSGARTNQRLANGIEVLSPCKVVSTRESSVCFPGFMEVLETWNDLWTGDGPLISSRGEAGSTCEPWPIRKSAGGVGISTPCGEVSTRMISGFVPGLSEL